MRFTITIIFIALLSACSGPEYVRQSWVKMPVEEANAYCKMESSKYGGPDFEDCMYAQGWRPAYYNDAFAPKEKVNGK